MCPYLKANEMAILKELYREYSQNEPIASAKQETRGWLSPLKIPRGFPIPTEQLATTDYERIQGAGESLLDMAAREASFGMLEQVSCSETFHAEPPALAAVLLQLEKALGEPHLGAQILRQAWEAPCSQMYLKKDLPYGRATFWMKVGYHGEATTLKGTSAYGIQTTIGFSYQGSKKPAQTKKSPKRSSKKSIPTP